MTQSVIPGLGLQAHTLFCIGRNYAEHAKELGNAVPAEPVVFLKPLSTLCFSGDFIEIPTKSERVDHEVEIVVALGHGGRHVSVSEASGLIAGIGVGVDVTARDLQEAAKKKALPWTVAKGFDTFAPVSDFVVPNRLGDLRSLEFSLSVNGQERQRGNSSRMLFGIAELIAYLSTIFTLAPGDLIFTGTPEGVAPLQAGDRVKAELGGGLVQLEVSVRKSRMA